MKRVLAAYSIKPELIAISEIEPSEWETWGDAIKGLEIRADYRISENPVGIEFFNGVWEVQDGHHRTASAILRGESYVLGFKLPKEWSDEKINAFWLKYNNRGVK